MKTRTLFLIWLLAWLALTPVGVVRIPAGPSPEATLVGAALFALPSSLLVLAVAAIVLALFRRRPDKGARQAFGVAFILVLGVGSAILHEPTLPGAAAHFSNAAAAPVSSLAAENRAQADKLIDVVGGIAALLMTFNFLLYFSEPLLGARRIAVVAGVLTAVGTAVAITVVAAPELNEVLLAIMAVGVAAGLATTFALLLVIASIRWIRSGFASDRSRGAAAPPHSVSEAKA